MLYYGRGLRYTGVFWRFLAFFGKIAEGGGEEGVFFCFKSVFDIRGVPSFLPRDLTRVTFAHQTFLLPPLHAKNTLIYVYRR